ncbi:hypothetical protein AMECASPLE_026047 [Ameca splendens]|uniref:C-type lectin domain-containing protein n=1 Tax=Ameca splendens TaxID=208324 RepID=A0ABV0ZQL7_9TELE
MEKRRNLENQTENLNKTLNSALSIFTFPAEGFCTNKTCELCRRGWILFQEKCYLFSSMFCKTWKECQQFCTKMGADVADVDNLQEQEFISKSIQINYGSCDPNRRLCCPNTCDYMWIQLQVGHVAVPGLVNNQGNFTEKLPVDSCHHRCTCEDEALIIYN